MKHIKHDFRSKACVFTPGWTKGVRSKVEIQLFQNNIMLHFKFKKITNVATWTKIFCPQPCPHPNLGMRLKFHFLRTWS